MESPFRVVEVKEEDAKTLPILIENSWKEGFELFAIAPHGWREGDVSEVWYSAIFRKQEHDAIPSEEDAPQATHFHLYAGPEGKTTPIVYMSEDGKTLEIRNVDTIRYEANTEQVTPLWGIADEMKAVI